MSIKYKVVEIANPQDRTAPKKFYIRLVNSGTITLHALSKEIAGRSSLTVGDVKNAIEQFIDLVPLHLAEGKSVRLGSLGSLSLSCSSEGMDTADQVSAKNIKNIKATYRASTELKKTFNELKFEKEH